jgi:Holliday junction DNA helicase RuvB
MIEEDTRILSPKEDEKLGHLDDPKEESLRPKRLKEYIGQEQVKSSIALAIEAARIRNNPLDHVLLYGPPGLGKTTLAQVIAYELGAQVKITSGPAMDRAGDLASILTNLSAGDILFIDEIHRIPKTVEELLYSAMEDFVIDIMLGKGPTAQSLRLDLAPFTLIGATTKYGALTGPLRDRFGIIHRLEYYNEKEIEEILKRSSRILGIKLGSDAGSEISKRSRLTPRIANRVLRRVHDWHLVHGDDTKKEIGLNSAQEALNLLEIDHHGLDPSDRRIIKAIIDHYNGGPVGLDALAATTSEEKQTIEDVYEPYLIQKGFIKRTPRGRVVTESARKLKL